MRIVIDTNVLVAAMRSPSGINRQVIWNCLRKKATPLIGEKLFFEYEALASRSELFSSSPLSEEDRRQFLDGLYTLCLWCRVSYLWRPNLPDEGDNHLVELAIAGGAEAVVTNNVDDLTHGELEFPHLKILTPREFLGVVK